MEGSKEIVIELKNIKSILLGILGSLVFLLIGYELSGIYKLTKIPNTDGSELLSFSEALAKVITHPFSKSYFNLLTPICLVFSFVMFELVFLLVYLAHKGRNKVMDKTRAKSAILESSKKDENIVVEAQTTVNQISSEEIPVEENHNKKEFPEETMDEEIISEEREAYLPDDVVMALMDKEFTYDQIKEIINITKYMDNITISMITKMFNPKMSAMEIKQFIEVYYG